MASYVKALIHHQTFGLLLLSIFFAKPHLFASGSEAKPSLLIFPAAQTLENEPSHLHGLGGQDV